MSTVLNAGKAGYTKDQENELYSAYKAAGLNGVEQKIGSYLEQDKQNDFTDILLIFMPLIVLGVFIIVLVIWNLVL